MRQWIIVAAIGALFVCGDLEPLFAASQRDWADCSGPNAESSISACTSLIEDQTQASTDRAEALIYRGNAYFAKQDLARAIVDYGEAIQLNPKNVLAYSSRAIAYARQGDRDRAIADYRIANQLDPKSVAEMAAGNDELKKIGVYAFNSPTLQSAPQQPAAVAPAKTPKKKYRAAAARTDVVKSRTLDCSNPAQLFACANSVLSTLPGQ